jgi:hypothetical protein
MRLSDLKSHALGADNTEFNQLCKAIGDSSKLVFTATPATSKSSAGTVNSPTKEFRVMLKDAADGGMHTWFQSAIVKCAVRGTATLGTWMASPTTLNFVDGVATVIGQKGDTSSTATFAPNSDIMRLRIKATSILGFSIASLAVARYDLRS